MNFKIAFSSSVKHIIGKFKGIVLSLYYAFSNIAVFTMLILPIHEHVRFFHLLVASSISLHLVLFKYCLKEETCGSKYLK